MKAAGLRRHARSAARGATAKVRAAAVIPQSARIARAKGSASANGDGRAARSARAARAESPAASPATPAPSAADDGATEADPERREDQALVESCVAERPGAWARLVERYTPLIAAVARRTLRGRALRPSDQDIEDICENAFLAILKDDYKLLRAYDDRFALSTYLGVVARTHAGRYVRRKRHPTCGLDAVELCATASDPALEVEARDQRRAVRDTLEELSERDRHILRLFYFSNRDYQQIAAELGVSPNSVGAALHRARSRLKQRLLGRRTRSGRAAVADEPS